MKYMLLNCQRHILCCLPIFCNLSNFDGGLVSANYIYIYHFHFHLLIHFNFLRTTSNLDKNTAFRTHICVLVIRPGQYQIVLGPLSGLQDLSTTRYICWFRLIFPEMGLPESYTKNICTQI